MNTADVPKTTNTDSSKSIVDEYINNRMINFVFTTVMREENRRRAERA